MNRRSFLQSVIAACVAPAIVRADSLMRVVPWQTTLIGVDMADGPDQSVVQLLSRGPVLRLYRGDAYTPGCVGLLLDEIPLRQLPNGGFVSNSIEKPILVHRAELICAEGIIPMHFSSKNIEPGDSISVAVYPPRDFL